MLLSLFFQAIYIDPFYLENLVARIIDFFWRFLSSPASIYLTLSFKFDFSIFYLHTRYLQKISFIDFGLSYNFS